MKRKKREIAIFTDEQLQNSMKSKISIQVYVANELDYQGKIVGYTENTVITEEGSYLRGNCLIYTSYNYLKNNS